MEVLKTCRRCGLQAQSESDLDLFRRNKTGKHGRDGLCKACDNQTHKAVKAKDPKAWLEAKRNAYYKNKYGITLQDKVNLIEQGAVCEICGSELTNVRTAAVDHSHARGHVRGLLCNKCNTGLGKFNDDLELLDKAMKYLIRREYRVDPEAAQLGIGHRLDALFHAGVFPDDMAATIQAVKDKYPKGGA